MIRKTRPYPTIDLDDVWGGLIQMVGEGYIATAKAIKAVGAKHSGGKSLSKTHKLSARMLRPYPKVMP